VRSGAAEPPAPTWRSAFCRQIVSRELGAGLVDRFRYGRYQEISVTMQEAYHTSRLTPQSPTLLLEARPGQPTYHIARDPFLAAILSFPALTDMHAARNIATPQKGVL
jgi:hypothetical protein